MKTKTTNTIKWIRHSPTPPARSHRVGDTVYSSCGPFEWAGDGAFEVTLGNTIGKPYRLAFVSRDGVRQFAGAFQTVSGAKQAAKKFGTWRN